MPTQPTQWTEFLSCSNCFKEFTVDWNKHPITLACGHSICRECTDSVQKRGCQSEPTASISYIISNLGVNLAILKLVAFQNGVDVARPEDPPQLSINLGNGYTHYLAATEIVKEVGMCLRDIKKGILPHVSHLTKPTQRKLVSLVQCQLALEDGRLRGLRVCRAIGERSATELILAHQNPATLSGNLWTEVRARGCQFLGPAMQEEALKLILLALEDGSELSRKVLVMFVVQKLQQQFPQASKTSIGHVVQLLYRASCFVVKKREGDSSLMRLKEVYRTYLSLRREHDAQVVQIAREAGLRIAPDQWSALLYGDQDHKSHMQSVIDQLQSGESFERCIHDLSNAIKKSRNSGNLSLLLPHFEVLCGVNSENMDSAEMKNDWNLLLKCLEAVKKIMQTQMLWQDEDTVIQTGKYKTSFCRDMASKGKCPRGASCTFAHTEEELHLNRNKQKKGSVSYRKRTSERPNVEHSDPKANQLPVQQVPQPMERPMYHQYMAAQPPPAPQHRPQHQMEPNHPMQPMFSPGRYPQEPHAAFHSQPVALPPNMQQQAYSPSNQQQHQFAPAPYPVRPQSPQTHHAMGFVPRYEQPGSNRIPPHIPMHPASRGMNSQTPNNIPTNVMPQLTVCVSFQGTNESVSSARPRTSHCISSVAYNPPAENHTYHDSQVVHMDPRSVPVNMLPHGYISAMQQGNRFVAPSVAPYDPRMHVPQPMRTDMAPQGQGRHVMVRPVQVNLIDDYNRASGNFQPIQMQPNPDTNTSFVEPMAYGRVPVMMPMDGGHPKPSMVPNQEPGVAIVAPSPPITPAAFNPSADIVYQSPSPAAQPVLLAPYSVAGAQPQNTVFVPFYQQGQHGARMEHGVVPEEMQRRQDIMSAGGSSDFVREVPSVTPKSIDDATVEQLERRKDQIINKLIENQTEKRDDFGGGAVVTTAGQRFYDVWNSKTCTPFTLNEETAENLHGNELLTNVVDVTADIDTRTSQVTVRGTDHLNMSFSNNERALDDAKMHKLIVDRHEHRRSVKPPSTAKQPLWALIHYSSHPQADDDEMVPFSDRPTVSKYGPIARSVRTRPSETDVVQVNANADVQIHPVKAVRETNNECEGGTGQTETRSMQPVTENLHASHIPMTFIRDREVIKTPASKNHPTIPPATGAMTNTNIPLVQAASNSQLLQRVETALLHNRMQNYPEDLQLAMELQQIELGIHKKRNRFNL